MKAILMFTRIHKLYFTLATILSLVVACASRVPSIEMPIATVLVTQSPVTDLPTIHETTSTTTPLPTIAVDSIVPTISSPDYLKGCKELNSSTYTEQVGYNGIFPETTMALEVKKLVGNPRNVVTNNWLYEGYTISFDEQVVSQISVGVSLPSINEMVKFYGCPDVIFAYHLSVDEPNLETFGTLGMITFVYSHLGLEFEVWHYPAQLHDPVDGILYYAPKSLHDYIYDKDFRQYTLETPDVVKIATWNEALGVILSP